MKKENISYQRARMLSNLTRSYLAKESHVSHLFGFTSNAKNVASVISERENDFSTNREDLVESLRSQDRGFSTSKLVDNNIDSLLQSNTYTVTTGHQLNLFTGPLYFIYKIVSAVKATKALNKEYPDKNFVPIYWMATEDHDFEEINHTHVFGEKLIWDSEQTGMVGEFSTEGLGKVISELKNVLGNDIQTEKWVEILGNAYLKQSNLSDATRYLVNYLFQEEGLVIIDANTRLLKSQFSGVIKKELLAQKSVGLVNETIASFPLGSKAQVTPRDINLFYVRTGLRERIVKEGEFYTVNNTDYRFNEKEILAEVENYPERFSPNVILRPVYQELILPNVMYVGGGAEIAYWLQLKSTFSYYNASYPLLQIRNSFLIIDKDSVDKVLNCCLELEELFYPENEQVKILLRNDNPFVEELAAHKTEVNEKIKELIIQLEEFDPELIKSLKSTKQGFLKELKKLDQKIMKSVKRKQQVKLSRLAGIRKVIYPGGVYQERTVNVLEMLALYGEGFLSVIESQTEPFDNEISVLTMD